MNHPDLTWMLLEASRKAPTTFHPVSGRSGSGWSARRAIGRSLIQLGTRLSPTPQATTPETSTGQTTPLPRTGLT